MLPSSKFINEYFVESIFKVINIDVDISECSFDEPSCHGVDGSCVLVLSHCVAIDIGCKILVSAEC